MTESVASQELRRNVEFVGHTNLDGKADGGQVMVNQGFAYMGHLHSHGFSVVDVRDPSRPTPRLFVPAMDGCISLHLQAHGQLLLVANKQYAIPSTPGQDAKHLDTSQAMGGLRIYDTSEVDRPRQIAEMTFDGPGVHRIWYVGGRYAYLSVGLRGYSECIFMTVDISDPTAPREVARWWIPGMWEEGGETPTWDATTYRYGCHHPIIAHDTAYVTWRDGGLTLLDVSDPERPSLISHRTWCPPFGGQTHTAVPLTDRVPTPKPYVVVMDEGHMDNCADQVKYTWMVDVREPSNPVTVSTFPNPSEQDYPNLGGIFGGHNLHENRPGSFQSSDLMFATYQNAGVRVFDIRDPMRPSEVGYFVPDTQFEYWMDPRPNRPRVNTSMDVFVDAEGLMYVTDMNAGLRILEWKGE